MIQGDKESVSWKPLFENLPMTETEGTIFKWQQRLTLGFIQQAGCRSQLRMKQGEDRVAS
jgi:hypothetical protein